MSIEAAILGSAAISGLGSYFGAKKSAKALKKAAKIQYRMYEQTRSDLAPWRATGKKGLYALADLLGVDTGKPRSERFGYLTRPFEFEADPGYQFRLREGEKALNRLLSSRGLFFSGRAGRELMRYGQDYASNEFQKAYNRYADEINRLYRMFSGLSDTGRLAATQSGAFSMQAGRTLADLFARKGATEGSGYMGIGNALIGSLGPYLNYKLGEDYLTRLERMHQSSFGGQDWTGTSKPTSPSDWWNMG